MVSGILGVPLGSYLSTKLVKRFKRIDPIICGFGLLVSAPFMTVVLFTVQFHTAITYVCIFFAELALNLNWAIVADILLVRMRNIYEASVQIKKIETFYVVLQSGFMGNFLKLF